MVPKTLIEWSVVGGILLLLLYTLFIIKNEKSFYFKNGRWIQFANFEFLIPSWWSPLSPSHLFSLDFERQDTRYDWKASFLWIPDPALEEKTLKEIAEKFLSEQKIVFDPQEVVSSAQDQDKIFQGLSKLPFKTEALRMEGRATLDHEERIYLDTVFIKDWKNKGLLILKSQSSVLNGLIEGPYFEEMISQMRAISESN